MGFAISACLGGVLDLTGSISKWLIVGYLITGAIASAWFVFTPTAVHSIESPKLRPSRLALPLAGFVGVLLAVRVAGTVSVVQPPGGKMQAGSFNTYDDFQAYLVYPLKMLETGSMGSDPFSAHRTPTFSLGGNAFLQTFILAALPVQSLKLLDVGIGTILVVGLLSLFMARLRLTTFAATCVMLLFLAVPPPLGNVTAVLMPVALFVSLYLVLTDDRLDGSRLARAMLIGVHVAAICVLKSNLMPAALVFLGAQAVLGTLRAPSWRGAVADGLLWFGAAAVAIVPWLLDALRWTGTFIPELAAYHADPTRLAGFHAATGWRFLIPHLKELPRPPFMFVILSAAVVLALRSRVRVPDAFWSLLAAAAVGTIAVTVAMAGAANNIYNYMYAFVMPALLIALIRVIAAVETLPAARIRAMVFTGLATAALLVLAPTARAAARIYRFNLSSVARALRGEQLVAPSLVEKYRKLQRAIPAGASLLERMDDPFLFDFRRNRVLIDALPGWASPAPGEPFFAGAEALADYLVSHGIRYVAYDYQSQAGMPRSGPVVELANDDRYPSAQSTVRLILDFDNSLDSLGRTRHRVYDDGTAFAVDLLAMNPAR